MFLFPIFLPYTSQRLHSLKIVSLGCSLSSQFRELVHVVRWDTLSHCCQRCKNNLQKNSIWARDAEVALVTALRAETSRHLVNYDCDSPLSTDVVPRSTSWWWRWEEHRQKQLVTDNKASGQGLKMNVYFWCHDSVIMPMMHEAPGSKSFSLLYMSSLWEKKYFCDKLAKSGS